LETKIERQKWKNVRNKMVQIKGVEFKSPLIIKVENKMGNEKNKRQPSQIIGTSLKLA
jgi:hypothetical protein